MTRSRQKRISSRVRGLRRSRLSAERCRNAARRLLAARCFDLPQPSAPASSFRIVFEPACRWARLPQWRLRIADSRIFEWNRRRGRTSRKVAPRAKLSGASRPIQTTSEARIHGICGGVSFTGTWAGPSHVPTRMLPQFARQAGHFDSGKAGLVALVAAFESSAVDRLLQGVACQYAQNHGHARIQLSELNAASGLRHDDIVVRSFSAQNTSDANN